SGKYIVNWKDGQQSFETADSDEAFTKDFLSKHKADILFAEPTYEIRTQVVEAKEVNASSADANWGVTRIRADVAWAQNIKGQGVKVAVIDSGVDFSHPQLAYQVAPNMKEYYGQAGVDDDGNGLVDDIYGWNFFEYT